MVGAGAGAGASALRWSEPRSASVPGSCGCGSGRRRGGRCGGGRRRGRASGSGSCVGVGVGVAAGVDCCWALVACVGRLLRRLLGRLLRRLLGRRPAAACSAASCAACSAASWAAACSAASWAALAAASAAACSSADWRFSASRTLIPWRSASSAMRAVLESRDRLGGRSGLRLGGQRRRRGPPRPRSSSRSASASASSACRLATSASVAAARNASYRRRGRPRRSAWWRCGRSSSRCRRSRRRPRSPGGSGRSRSCGRARRCSPPAGATTSASADSAAAVAASAAWRASSACPARPVVGLGRLGGRDGGLAELLVGHDEVGLHGRHVAGLVAGVALGGRDLLLARHVVVGDRGGRDAGGEHQAQGSGSRPAQPPGQVRRTAWCGCRQGWHRCSPRLSWATGDFPFTRDTCGTLVLTSPNGNNFPNFFTNPRRVDLTNYKVVIRRRDPHFVADLDGCWPLHRPASDKIPASAGILASECSRTTLSRRRRAPGRWSSSGARRAHRGRTSGRWRGRRARRR